MAEEKANTKSIKRNYLYNMIYQVLILILPLVTTPYLSRVLGAEGIGIYGYTYAIVTYFILFGSLGVSLYGQREIAYAQEKPEKRMSTFVELILFRFITIAIAIIPYAMFFIYGKNNYQFCYRILLIEIIAAAFDISWFFQGMEEFKKTVTRNVFVRVCSVTCVFVFVKTKEDLSKFILIYSLGDLIGNISLWLYLPKYFKGVKVKNIGIRKHFIPVMMLFIPQIANQVYKILDTTMIGRIIPDKTETGYYEQAQKVIRLLLTIVTSLGVVMIPRMANTFANNDKEKIQQYLKISFRFVFFLSFPIMMGISAVAHYFVPIFFGAGYDKVIILIRIICPILLLMGIGNVLGTQYLIPTKRQKEYTISVIIGIIVNFILNIILITRYASIGASIATVISELIVIIVQYLFVREDISIKDILRIAWKYFVAAIIMLFACSLIGYMNNYTILAIRLIELAEKTRYSDRLFLNMFNLGVTMLFGGATYFASLIVLKDEFVFRFLDRISNKIMNRKNPQGTEEEDLNKEG